MRIHDEGTGPGPTDDRKARGTPSGDPGRRNRNNAGASRGKEDTKDDGKGRFLRVRADAVVGFAGDVAVSVAIVVGVGAFVYAVTGAWPPVVAPEGGSMEPSIATGSVLMVSGPSGVMTDASVGRGGVVTHERGKETGYETFGDHGDVILYRPEGNGDRRPILHRAMFYLEEGERYETKGKGTRVAPHDGFVTKGDANPYYDQTRGISVVKPGWVEGKARHEVLDPESGSVPAHAFEGITGLFS